MWDAGCKVISSNQAMMQGVVKVGTPFSSVIYTVGISTEGSRFIARVFNK